MFHKIVSYCFAFLILCIDGGYILYVTTVVLRLFDMGICHTVTSRFYTSSSYPSEQRFGCGFCRLLHILIHTQLIRVELSARSFKTYKYHFYENDQSIEVMK